MQNIVIFVSNILDVDGEETLSEVIEKQLRADCHDEDGEEYRFALELLNPLVTNELSHRYHLDESTFILRGIRREFLFLFHFLINFA